VPILKLPPLELHQAAPLVLSHSILLAPCTQQSLSSQTAAASYHPGQHHSNAAGGVFIHFEVALPSLLALTPCSSHGSSLAIGTGVQLECREHEGLREAELLQ
jgi:hypothetical protein